MTALIAAPGPPMTVGVIGAGTMGSGIALVALEAGHTVLLHDDDPAALERGRARVEAALDRSLAKGVLSPEGRDDAVGRLRPASGLGQVAADADLVIEAVLEDLGLKRTIFRALDLNAHPEVPLATNTSSLSVAEIAEATHHRERVLGLHFFNPVALMALVEVVAAETTGRDALNAGLDFVAGLGKTSVVCGDAPGFIVNRVNRAFTLEPLRMLEAGQSDIHAIDAAIEAAGYRMGPFRLMDLVGIDVNYAVARSLYRGFDEAGRFRPSAIQAEMVDAGTLGRKAGRGFYRYDEAPDTTPEAASPAVPASAMRLSDHEIVERVNLAIVNEAYRAVGERVASPQDIDLAMRLGANHPMGPFERAGEVGLRGVVEGLRRLHAAAALSADQYEIAPLLWQLATA